VAFSIAMRNKTLKTDGTLRMPYLKNYFIIQEAPENNTWQHPRPLQKICGDFYFTESLYCLYIRSASALTSVMVHYLEPLTAYQNGTHHTSRPRSLKKEQVQVALSAALSKWYVAASAFLRETVDTFSEFCGR